MNEYERKIMFEIKAYGLPSNVNPKEIEAIRETIVSRICKEDIEYARRKLLTLLNNFGRLSACKEKMEVFKQTQKKEMLEEKF